MAPNITWSQKPRLNFLLPTNKYKESNKIHYPVLKKAGILKDLLPSTAWIDALRVIWYDLRGLFWQRLMVGASSDSGGLLINAALMFDATKKLDNVAEVIDL